MKNLPLDGEVLNMTMALFDYTLAPDLINKWIKRVAPFLYCESKAKKQFEEQVRAEQKKVIADTGISYNIEEEASGANRIMPFEFLYLLTNARSRAEALTAQKAPEILVTKEFLSEFVDGDERRPDLEWIYPLDMINNRANFIKSIGRERALENNGRRWNPRERLQEEQK